ncbi:hypothetical protein G4B88_007484 [Cannabis sativa]|uniref:Uncharacterized protein n=1 Tax=Cannabis sativa TaxID=3483 RepID=A0A7J6HBP5_CANSA|nr:hypothetical protein G4B88_007484 [Cannabis sativa]
MADSTVSELPISRDLHRHVVQTVATAQLVEPSLEKTKRFRLEVGASPDEYDMATLSHLHQPLKIRHI